MSVHLNAIESAPAIPEPTISEGITCSGSAAANGIAPSVMKLRPITMFAGPVFLSASVYFFLDTIVEIAIAIGGTIPPTITAAMIM